MTGANANADLSAVQRAIEEFIEAFDKLDWERFRKCFSDQVTVFFPFDDHPCRVDGKSEVEAIFQSFFEEVRKRAPGPPYLQLNPTEVKVQLFNGVAIVTFHLDRPDGLGRRSIVFQKQNGSWMIVHLQASRISQQK